MDKIIAKRYISDLFKFATMLLVIAMLVESPRLSLALAANDIPLAETPLIDVDARTAYTGGSITKVTAINRINSHLRDLENEECIQDWEESDGKYLIIMNNGAQFSYHLK